MTTRFLKITINGQRALANIDSVLSLKEAQGTGRAVFEYSTGVSVTADQLFDYALTEIEATAPRHLRGDWS